MDLPILARHTSAFAFSVKKTKFLMDTRNRELLVQCRDMRADSSIRKMATLKSDSNIVSLVLGELTAAEACYHRI